MTKLFANSSCLIVALVLDASAPEERFTIVASVNHSLMDGHTLHRLFNMLSMESSVQSLNPCRQMSAGEEIREKLGTRKLF